MAEIFEGISNGRDIIRDSKEFEVAVRGKVFTAGGEATFLIAFDRFDAICRDFLGIDADGSDTKRLIAGVCEDIEDGAEDPIDATGVEFLSGGAGDLFGKSLGARGGDSHGTGELADVGFIIETVDASILLVQGDEEGYRVASLAGQSLQVKDEFCGLFSSCGRSRSVQEAWRGRARANPRWTSQNKGTGAAHLRF